MSDASLERLIKNLDGMKRILGEIPPMDRLFIELLVDMIDEVQKQGVLLPKDELRRILECSFYGGWAVGVGAPEEVRRKAAN